MSVAINETNFPDPIFRAYVQKEIMGNSSATTLTDAKIASTTHIELEYQELLTDLKGIEYFTALESLVCYNTQLASLDVSNNKNLTYFECISNPTTSINAAGCMNLSSCTIFDVPLITINLSNAGISYFNDNLPSTLHDINLSGCVNLEHFGESFPDLVSLDLSGCTSLIDFGIGNASKLTHLNVSGCTSLYSMYISSTSLTKLNLSGLSSLVELNCSNNHLTSLDASSCLLEVFEGSGQTRGIDSNNITYNSNNVDKPYELDLRPYVDDILKVSQVEAYDLNSTPIASTFSNGIVSMAEEPNSIRYYYSVVLNGYNETTTMDVILYILPSPVITTSTLPNAILQTAYNAVIEATGTSPITFSITAGSLPPGLTLDANTGVISGTPTME